MSKVRERILKRAFKIFSKKGFDGARMDDIGKAAKVNKATIYYYFDNKRALYEEVLYLQLAKLSPKIVEALTLSDGEPEELIRRVVEVYFRFLEQHPDVLKLFLREVCRGGNHLRNALRKVLQEQERAVKEGSYVKLEDTGLLERIGVDSLNFWLNIVGMVIIHFLAFPFVEEIYKVKVDEGFVEKRKESVLRFVEKVIRCSER